MNLEQLVFVILISFSTIFVFADSNDEIELLISKAIDSFQLGEFKQAISYLDQILEIDPINLDALNSKGGALIKLGRMEEAVTYFDKVLEADPNHVGALINKGVYLAELGREKEAITYFTKVLEIEPDYDFSKHNLAKGLNLLYTRVDGYVEIMVYDSQDRLVNYIIKPELRVLKIHAAYDMIDDWPVSKTINRNGQDFNVHQTVTERIVNEDEIIGLTFVKMELTNFSPEDHKITSILGEDPFVFKFRRSQYIVEEGDTVYHVFTIFRPVE